jgi:glycosyltransferase involved in cell wall biosynthesis
MHDIIALTHPSLCKPTNVAHYRLLLGRVARRAARIVASSEATKADIIRHLHVDPDKVEVVYPGVDATFAAPASLEQRARARTRYALPDRFILFVGNLEPKKNLPTLIEAIALLKRQGKLAHKLVLAGRLGWKYRGIFQTMTRCDVEREVVLCDYVAQEDLPAVYQMANVFVFPSLCEGFGIPPVEAMASGTVVVCSDVPGLGESAGDAALIYSPNTAQELAKSIHKVLSNTFLRTCLASRGRERAQRFRWDDNARRMVQVYESVSQSAPKLP